MGGMTGEVRGQSKIDAYLRYVEELESANGVFQTHEPDPKFKKYCKSLMVQDPDSGEWVLRFHLHT